jgi:hypothetical protein
MLCWRRLRDWNQAGGCCRRNRAAPVSCPSPVLRSTPRCVPCGADQAGPSPVERALPGSKHHVITEAHGTPLVVSLTGGNRNDITHSSRYSRRLTGAGEDPTPIPLGDENPC